MAKEYKSKATVHSIKFTSRKSVKIKDSYYTIEACEERWLPETGNVDIEEERRLLWDTVNRECEDQIDLIYDSYNS